MRKLIYSSVCLWAVCLVVGCGQSKEQRVLQLEQLEQQNRSGEPMLNDSLAEDLVNYFDLYGDANERMRSRYILGRTYYCLGELPRALETYNEAADCADTTLADCNYKVLSRIHAQSAIIFNLQVQPHSQLDELRMAEYYAWKGKDSLQAIECFAQQGDVYAFWGMADSAIYIKEKASTLFKRIGKENRAYQTLGPTIRLLIREGLLVKARQYCISYEGISGLFDDNNKLVKFTKSIIAKVTGQETDINIPPLSDKPKHATAEGASLYDSTSNLSYTKNERLFHTGIAEVAKQVYGNNLAGYKKDLMDAFEEFITAYNGLPSEIDGVITPSQ